MAYFEISLERHEVLRYVVVGKVKVVGDLL